MPRSYTLNGPSPSNDQLSAARAVAVRQLLSRLDPESQVQLLTHTLDRDTPFAERESLGLQSISLAKILFWWLALGANAVARLFGLTRKTSPAILSPLTQAQAVIQTEGLGLGSAHPLTTHLLLTLAIWIKRPPLILAQERLDGSWIQPWTRWILKRALVVITETLGEMKALENHLVGRFLPRRQDVVLSLKPESPKSDSRLPPRFNQEGFALVVPNAEQGVESGRSLRNLVAELIEKQKKNVVIVATNEGDHLLSEAMAEALSHHSRIRVLPPSISPCEFVAHAANATQMVTARKVGWLHGLATSCPMLVLHPTPIIQEQLTELGLQHWGCYRGGELTGKFRELERQSSAVRGQLRERHGLLVQSSENNIQWALDPTPEDRNQRPFFQSALALEDT